MTSANSPIANVQPASTLLPPGTTALSLTVESTEKTNCAFALGSPEPYAKMMPFDQGAEATIHQTTLRDLDPDPNVVNNLYVRCASQPDYLLQLKYRSLSQANPPYPRTGNLWGWPDFLAKGPAYMARIDLWLGVPENSAATIRALRRLNPNLLALTEVNAIDRANLPDDYYLKDIHGRRLETWPGYYRLNLTKPDVAEFQAQFAYQRIVANDLMFDGIFFDNFATTQPVRQADIYGKSFVADADENGIEDDPAQFDAAWKAGVFHELETFRTLMPHALVMGHSMDIHEPLIAQFFNGISIGFQTADVLEGEKIFPTLWDTYNAWRTFARQPAVTMIESSPPDQIAYGYGYDPQANIPPATLEFARTYYPYMRFGLALTLLNDGYFTHEFGDTWHGNDWWYDELNFDLGYPLGPAMRVNGGVSPGENLLVNGGFENASTEHWRLEVEKKKVNHATVNSDTSDKVAGKTAARIDVTAVSGVDWHIALAQDGRSLQQGLIYDVTFWAKSDRPRPITLSAQKGSPDWRGYGLSRQVNLDPTWKQYTVSFAATETTRDARLQFLLGETTGMVWLDDVQMAVHLPDVYQREFTHGLVLLNGSREPQTITVPPGYARLQGQQAPRYETIVDDQAAAFSITGDWTKVKYDSGEWQATGPFYHCWQVTCHVRHGTQGEARWALALQAADTYTITAWWPAVPPQAAQWNQQVTYEVVAGDQVIAAKTLDQRSGGDEWHWVATVALSPADKPYVRMRCLGAAPCLADALYLRSHARYNDGATVAQVTLQPLDGIILARLNAPAVHLPTMRK